MRKKLALIVGTLMLLQIAWLGTASAAYKPAGNINVGLTLLPGLIQPTSALGNLTFQLQEAVHDTVTNATGIEIDHSYAVVGLNGEPLLAVDPPVVLINKKK